MSTIIPFEIYRTEEININDQQFRVQFMKIKNEDRHEILAVNSTRTKTYRGSYSEEDAQDFKHYTGKKLEEAVYSVLKNDMAQKATLGL